MGLEGSVRVSLKAFVVHGHQGSVTPAMLSLYALEITNMSRIASLCLQFVEGFCLEAGSDIVLHAADLDLAQGSNCGCTSYKAWI